MTNMGNKIIYQLIDEDAQTVSEDVLGRRLTSNELESLEEILGKKIGWHALIEDAIYEVINSDEK